jgi:hypothetical protein
MTAKRQCRQLQEEQSDRKGGHVQGCQMCQDGETVKKDMKGGHVHDTGWLSGPTEGTWMMLVQAAHNPWQWRVCLHKRVMYRCLLQ